jgi:Pectate lyase superfamily protein
MANDRFDVTETFPSTGGTTNRSMAVDLVATPTIKDRGRLNDIINVKDFGATGRGLVDDSGFIQDALNYAWDFGKGRLGVENGAKVFFPPGLYRIDTTLVVGNASGGSGFQWIFGAGRDATVLKGNISGGYIVSKPESGGTPQLGNIECMTIWNTSVTSGSGAMFVANIGDACGSRFKSVRFKGMGGLQINHDAYNHSIENCVFEGPGSALGVVDVPAVNSHGKGLIASATWTAAHTETGGSGSQTVPAAVTITTTVPHGMVPCGVAETGAIDRSWLVLLDIEPSDHWMQNLFGPEWTRITPRTATTFEYTLDANPNAGANPVDTVNSFWWYPPGPVPTTVGLWSQQAHIIGCRAAGFDVGIALDAIGQALIGCSAERCNVGFQQGCTPPFTTNTGDGGGTFLGFLGTRCTRGYYNYGGSASLLAGCVFRDDPNETVGVGVAEPVPIQSMTWSGGIVEVTTVTPHNIVSAAFSTVRLLNVNPVGFTTNGTGTQTLPFVNVTSPTKFTYTGVGSNPGSFVSGRWCYPLWFGVSCKNSRGMGFKALHIPMTVYLASFDTTGTWPERGEGGQFCNVAMGMSPAGPLWGKTDASSFNGNFNANSNDTDWTIVQFSGKGTIPSNERTGQGRQFPTPTMNFAGVNIDPGHSFRGSVLTEEWTILDAPAANFGDPITVGGGSNHYKIRWNGSGWTRVG